MVQDINTLDRSVFPQANQGIDRLTRVGRDWRQFSGSEGVAQLAALTAHRIRQGLVIERGYRLRCRVDPLNLFQGQFASAGPGGEGQQQRGPQQEKESV